MVIKEMHIDGFGIFNDFSLQLPGKGIHIILGDNEAGKSSMLKFIRYTLFGYPRLLDQRMAPLLGGNHGGRIKATLSAGTETVFERDGRDRIKLTWQGQESVNSSQWTQLLGNASADLYCNVYAFTLDELAGLSSLNDSGMEDKIFSLGVGLGNISISEIENRLRIRSEEVYKTRGKTQLIPSLLKEIEEKNIDIRHIQDNLSQYRQLTTDVQQLENQSSLAEQELKRLRNEHATLDANLRCYESFVMLKKAEQELVSMPDLKKYPEKGVQSMERALETQTELTNKILQLEQGGVGEKGINEIEDILENTLVNNELLKHKEKVDYLRLNLGNYKQTLRDRAEESRQLRENDEKIRLIISDKINSRWSEYDVLSFHDTTTHQSRVEEFSASLRNTTDEKRDWEAREKVMMSTQDNFKANPIAKLLAVIFLIGAVPLYFYGWFVAAGAGFLIAIILFLGRNAFERKDALAPVRERISDIEEEQKRILNAYQSWLKDELKLAPDLSFSAVSNVFQCIDTVKALMAQRDRIRLRIQEERLPLIFDFEGRAAELAKFIESAISIDDKQLLANTIINEYDEAARIYEETLALQEDLKRKKKENQQFSQKLVEVNKTIDALLKAVDAEDTTEFFHNYSANERVKELLLKHKYAKEKIEAVAGLNKATEVINYLSVHDKQTLQTAMAELTQSVADQETLITSLYKDKGAKLREKERLAGESELAEQLTELETTRQKLYEAYKEWLSGQLAQKILAQVKTTYENNKQPAVIKNSAAYFTTITGGEYLGIRTSLEGREMSVFDCRETSRNITQLSRGTKEQLLVSLRLGFIEEYEKQAEPLPVIVDEILVNFDPQRARETAQILTQFAASRQVLLFTCQPSTIDLFDKGAVNVVKMRNGKLLP